MLHQGRVNIDGHFGGAAQPGSVAAGQLMICHTSSNIKTLT